MANLTRNAPSAVGLPEETLLSRQLDFLAEADKLKDVLRRTVVSGTRRQENSAEHSWHLALMAILLVGQADIEGLDLLRTLKMVLIHDLVEIDAGDSFYYDALGRSSKQEREQAAARRLFGLLPSFQTTELYSLWTEFEEKTTPESHLARALDRLQPILQNLRTEGTSWRFHGVTKEMVLERNQEIGAVLPSVWRDVVARLDFAETQGYFLPVETSPTAPA